MNHLLTMGIIERLSRLFKQVNAPFKRERTFALHKISQRFALNILHRQEMKALILPNCIDRHNMRMLQGRYAIGFLVKTLHMVAMKG